MRNLAILSVMSGVLSTVFFLNILKLPLMPLPIALGMPGILYGVCVLAWLVPPTVTFRLATRVFLIFASWGVCAAAAFALLFIGERVLGGGDAAKLAAPWIDTIVSGVAAVMLAAITVAATTQRLRSSMVVPSAVVGGVAGALFGVAGSFGSSEYQVLTSILCGATFISWQLGMTIVLGRASKTRRGN